MILKPLLNTRVIWMNKNIKEQNPNKERKILIVFGDIITDMLGNKKLNPIVTELFIRGRILNFTKLRIIIHQILTLKTLYKKSTAKPYSVLVIDATLA